MVASIWTASSSDHGRELGPATGPSALATRSSSRLRLRMPISVQRVAGLGARTMRYTSALAWDGGSRASWIPNERARLDRDAVGGGGAEARWSCTSTIRQPEQSNVN